MIFALLMYYVHTCTCIYGIVCLCYRHVHRCWYRYVHRCWYMYGHCTHTSVHVHSCTSFPIIPDQPCDAGESLLRAGAAPSELPPSWHQSVQLTDHPGAACHVQIATATGSPHGMYVPDHQRTGCAYPLHKSGWPYHVYTLYIQLFILCIYIVHTWFIHWHTMYMCTDYTMPAPLRQFPLRTRLSPLPITSSSLCTVPIDRNQPIGIYTVEQGI